MVVRLLFSWIVALVFVESVHAGIGEWKSYTDMKNVRSVATDGTVLWAGTSGGIFRFDPADSSYQKFTNAEGLSSNDVTAIFVDSYGDVWVGEQNGSVDIYSPRSGTWRYISNIADDKTKANRSINRFYQFGDNMYIATSFGLTEFSISKFEFGDTHLGFSTLIQPVVAAVSMYQNRIFVATNGGIAATKPGATNLTDPQSWEILSTISSANSFGVFNGTLFAGTGNGLLQFQNNVWNSVGGITGVTKILTHVDTSLFFAEAQQVKSLSVSNTVATIGVQTPNPVVGGAIVQTQTLFLGLASSGIGMFNTDQQSWKLYFPNGPYSNYFSAIVFDENNVLWAASARSNGGGFYAFNRQEWTNYHRGNNPLVLSNDCFAIAVGPNNSKWIGTWGEGLLLVNSQGNIVRRFDYDNPGFIGVVRDINVGIPSYTVPGGIGVDQSGAVWVTVYGSINGSKVIWKMNRDSTWESYPGSPFGSPPSFMRHIVVDGNNTKWFVNSIVGSNTVDNITANFFNEKNTLPGTVNGWGVVTENDGLTNDRIYSIAIDISGDLWFGTGNGITIITNPSRPTERVTRVFQQSVRDQAIHCIAIDPLNNKWLGTSKGVFVLSPDGTQLLDQFSVENTGGKLVDNTILSIAFDKNRGIAYFGTEKGLSSLEIAPVSTKSSMSTIDLSPNPVYLPTHGAVEIRGLVEESTIKVLSIYGKVLKQFPAQGGGRAFWDCTDGEGNSVATGVYIIVAHDRNGTQVASAKVAVIRK